ncbi:MAG: molecular chaperone TorD family protein [Acidimicrobiales bacterium]
MPGRWELLRAVGAVASVAPPGGDHIATCLGLTALTAHEHTELFVMSLPPYAGIYLGPEGKLGGEGADRVAGLWRTLGLGPPPDADHLGALLLLYAELGEAAHQSALDVTRQRLEHIRVAMFWEHLWSWMPAYLDAAAYERGGTDAWVDLARRVIWREAQSTPSAGGLPLALRSAPEPINSESDYQELLDAATVPVRTGFILTRGDIASAAAALGLGLRRGERRFALKAMFEQDPGATLTWLAGHARGWESRHRLRPAVANECASWWAKRASHTADVLSELSQRAQAPTH